MNKDVMIVIFARQKAVTSILIRSYSFYCDKRWPTVLLKYNGISLYLDVLTLQVHQDLSIFTLQLCVSLIDQYLVRKPIVLDRLQLLGVACLLIASKYEDRYPPSVSNCIWYWKNILQKYFIVGLIFHICIVRNCMQSPAVIKKIFCNKCSSFIPSYYFFYFLTCVTYLLT